LSPLDVLFEKSMNVYESEAQIAAGVGAGERAALEEAYDRYGGAIHSLALRVLKNQTLAEDILQDTMLAFWRSPDSFDANRGSLRSYLLTIAHRRAVDLVRSEQARTRRESRPPEPERGSLEDEVISLVVSESVREALISLDEGERESIAMAYLGGYSYVETARRLGEPEGTVKSRIRSGMKKLAVALEGVSS
jgi:RNA polymerase sigma-70 factor, ECF subfamily